ncbi:hypothetical protein FF100_33210 [Methylobacterium terricola]|uniref:Uncharacterized protein n=1 Tax=Methylobacterium terricola TaxID=2583531 RepID=A0A5C4L8Z7_9HYPH|nr:hypothetical protein [Methylobacterium terricola]TNC07163.1 hypothetical protein FF100_33210 [Methylobacterium terricola]
MVGCQVLERRRPAAAEVVARLRVPFGDVGVVPAAALAGKAAKDTGPRPMAAVGTGTNDRSWADASLARLGGVIED